MLRWARLVAEGLFAAASVLLILLPAGLLLAAPWKWGGTSESPAELLVRLETRTIAAHTLQLALVVTLLTMAFAVFLVAVLGRVRGSRLAWLIPLLMLPLLSDQLARNYGWYFLLRQKGVVNHLLLSTGLTDAPLTLLYRNEAVAAALFQGLFPLAVIPVLIAYLRIDRSAHTVSMTLGAAPFQRFRTITMPLLLPGFALGAVSVFAAALGFFVTPKMLGGDAGLTVTGLIDLRINLLLDWPGATSLGSLLVFVSLPFLGLFLVLYPLLRPLEGFQGIPKPPQARASTAAFAVAAFVLFVLALAPVLPVALASINNAAHLSFPPTAFTWRWFEKVVSDPDWLGAWRVSAVSSTIAATLAIVLAAGAVSIASRSRRWTDVVLFLAAIPLLLPPIALSIALYRVLVGAGLGEEWVRLILGQTLRALPYPTLILLMARKGLDPALPRAVEMYGRGKVWSWVSGVWPHYAPAVMVSFLLAWLTCFNDFEYALYLSGPATTTLPLRVWTGLSYSVEPTVAACSVLTTAIGFVVLAAAVGLLGRITAPSES